MVTDQDLSILRSRVIHLEGQINFLYKHLGIEFVPEPSPADDPRIIEQVKKGNMLEAIKIHREINGSSLPEAKEAVEEIKGRLGI